MTRKTKHPPCRYAVGVPGAGRRRPPSINTASPSADRHGHTDTYLFHGYRLSPTVFPRAPRVGVADGEGDIFKVLCCLFYSSHGVEVKEMILKP